MSRASRITNRMIAAAADAVAAMSNARPCGAPLLPPINDLRTVSAAVAIAVSRRPSTRGWRRYPSTNPIQQVQDAMWRPEYPRLEI